MSELYKTYRKKDGSKVLKVYYDSTQESPRTFDEGNLGIMVCSHKRYDLPNETKLDSNSFSGWENLKNYIVKNLKAEIILPLYMLNHSGLTVKTTPFKGIYGYFDSGQIGFIFVSKETLRKEKLTKEKATKLLDGEIETFNYYLNGDVYGFILSKLTKCGGCGDEKAEEENSCWGFYGSDFEDNGLFESADVNIDEYEEVN